MSSHLNLSALKVSAHAWKAMTDRAVSPEDLVEILRSPEVVEPHEGRRRFVRGQVAVVVAGTDAKPVVVTVLLRERRTWTSADMRSR